MPEREARVIGLIDGAVMNLDHVETILNKLLYHGLVPGELDFPRAVAEIERARQWLANVEADLLLAAQHAQGITGGEQS